MRLYEMLQEVHWEDIYSDEFKTFRKEWGKISRTREGNDYYVQFSNFKRDSLERVGQKTPDHSDPVGDFAYPLKYAIDHPADIWYGRTAKWIRVLKDVSRNKLVLQHLNPATAHWYLHKMGISGDLMDYAKKHFKYKGTSADAKSFFAAIQHDLTQKPVDKEYPRRSPEMQTQLLLRAGIDAVEDRARNQNAASINEREPQQIVFLHRSAFEVVKVYNMGQGSQHSLAWIQPEDRQKRKLAALLVDAIDGDRLISGPEDKFFWTAKGRRIYVDFENVKPTDDRKIGEKKHKEFRLSDHYKTKIEIDHSEKGKISGFYDEDEKFQDIIRDMVRKWQEKKDQPSFAPDTRQEHRTRKEAESKAYYAKYAADQEAKEIKEEEEMAPMLQKLASKLGLFFRPIPGRDYKYSQIIKAVINGLRHTPNIESYWSEQAGNYAKLRRADPEMTDGQLFEFGYLPANLSLSNHPDIFQLKQLINTIHEQEPIRGPYNFYNALRNVND